MRDGVSRSHAGVGGDVHKSPAGVDKDNRSDGFVHSSIILSLIIWLGQGVYLVYKVRFERNNHVRVSTCYDYAPPLSAPDTTRRSLAECAAEVALSAASLSSPQPAHSDLR